MSKEELKKLHKFRRRAVWAGFSTNVIIAVVKWVAFYRSSSSAVFSEALHSSADSINSLLLFVGLWSSRKPADDEHPYGYGKDAYFWALIAAIFMLGVISTSSITAGFNHITHNEEILDFNFALFGLIVSFVMECIAVYIIMYSLLASMSIETGKKMTFRDLWSAFRNSDSPSIKLVFIEDSMSLSGATIALVAVAAVKYTNIQAIDGIGAIVIGCMLGALAMLLASENREKLIGSSAPDRIERQIYITAMNYPPIRDVADLKTMVMGPNKAIAHLRIELDPSCPVERMDDITEELENRIIKNVAQITDTFIEVIADEDAPESVDSHDD